MQITCLMILLLLKLVRGETDVEALLALKKSIIQNDLSAKALDSWDTTFLASDGCPRNWFGISCTGGSVTAITLKGLGLSGPFDFSAVSKLKMLRNLSLSNNHFMGPIQDQVGSIQSLEVLDLSCNLFNGTIPAQLADLKNMMLLNLSYNNFESKFPAGVGNLKKLKYLDLGSNWFIGDVMSLFLELGGVVYVDLSSNRFSGALDLGLANASFVSDIQYLNVSHNSLGGELFSHDGLPYFDSLEVFDASYNQFLGNVPSFDFIVSLRIIRLASNKLSGSLPVALLQGNSMVLSELDLSLNQLEGPIASITSATLRYLNLSSNKLSGPLPVRVSHTAIMDLHNNIIYGNISRIGYWGSYVEVIDLSSNLLTGTFPNQASQFLRLRSLKVSNNSLEGTLPPVFGMYTELEVIDLSLNRLSGIIPPYLFDSMRLRNLNLSYNNFTGPITFVNSTQNLSLLFLSLSHNLLKGELPAGLGNFQNVIYLDLSSNQFQGGLPNNLPDKLVMFNVSYNNLSGVIPEKLRRFSDSSFHPGNSLLIFPFSPSSPELGSSIGSRGHRSRLKSAIRAAVISGVVAVVSIMVVLSLLIYYRNYRNHKQESNRNSWKGDDEGKGIQRDTTPKNMDPSISSDNISEQIDISSVVQRSSGFGLSMRGADPSPSENKDLSPYLSPLTFSPNKLAGDLNLFDGSFSFTAEELSRTPAEVIGKSCHGMLYRVVLDCGHLLAVKWLKEGIAKGKKDFVREAKKLGNIKHPNLVSLLGYYWGPKENEKLLVSTYVDAPCLAFYLQEPEKLPPLSPGDRLSVAVDVARCLNYLHNEGAIPHGNLKSTNILIQTPGPTTLLTDYSLHRLMTSAGTSNQVLNAGALGYRPPEFATTSKPCPSLKSDVYAFGVILLELLTGQSSGEVDSGTSGVIDLTEWVRLLAAENRSIECFDKELLGARNAVQPRRDLGGMLEVALRCILPASERPDVATVFEDLSSIVIEEGSVR